METTGQIIETTGLIVATLLAVIVIFWVALDIWEKFVEKNKTKPEPKPDYKFTDAIKNVALDCHKDIIKEQREHIHDLETKVRILEERLKTYEEICR